MYNTSNIFPIIWQAMEKMKKKKTQAEVDSRTMEEIKLYSLNEDLFCYVDACVSCGLVSICHVTCYYSFSARMLESSTVTRVGQVLDSLLFSDYWK